MVNFVMLDKAFIKNSSKLIEIIKGKQRIFEAKKHLIRMTNFHQFSIYEISKDSRGGML